MLHEPVLLNETIEALAPLPGESYLDLTGGYGGHASVVLQRTENYKDAVLVDRDEFAVKILKEKFLKRGVLVLHTDFYTAAQDLVAAGRKFDKILLDLGVSSVQLDDSSRGFSFLHEAALDMRMDKTQEFSAWNVVNKWREAGLAEIFEKYGEVSRGLASKVAQKIVRARPINTTTELAELIKSSMGYTRKHPATKFFQAIRIVVNDELGLLERTLPLLPGLLKKQGRCGIISFHSLEDRIVKEWIRGEVAKGLESRIAVLDKEPAVPTEHEIVINPRSRSAKLRVFAARA